MRKGVDGYQWTYSDRDPVSRANFILTRPQLDNLVNKSPTFFQPVTEKIFKEDVEFVIGYVKCGKHWCLCRGKQLLPEDFNLNDKNAKIFYYEDLQLSDKVAVMCGIDESLVVNNVKNVVFFNMQKIFTALKAVPKGEKWNDDSASQVEHAGASKAKGGGASKGERIGSSKGEGGCAPRD
jgi:hypothetical protein